VEAAVAQWKEGGGDDGDDAPSEWGILPRAVLALMRDEGVRSLRASAVEVYNELVFDLMRDRAQLTVGSNKHDMGNRVKGPPDRGGSEAQSRCTP